MLTDRLMRIFGRGETEDHPQTDSAGAIVNEASTFIAAPPGAVFALLDPAVEGNRWSLRGDQVDAVDAAHGLYRLIDKRMPDQPFLIQVNDATPPSMMATMTVGDGGGPIGFVSKSLSRYEIEPAPGGCMVSLAERTQFLDGLSARKLKRHAGLMGESVRKDLERLKTEAEGAR